jgi:diketogulonate reductase-like aldo/keto reductase
MKVKLNNNYEMPIIGLGTWRSAPEDAYNAVLSALEAGIVTLILLQFTETKR